VDTDSWIEGGIMAAWLVTLKKNHTIEDIKNGAIGIANLKSVIIYCDKKDIKNKVIKENGYEIDKIANWNKIQAEALRRNLKWIWRDS